MANKTQTWKVTPDQYKNMSEQAKAAGLNISGNSGEVTAHGVKVSWTYDGSILGITVIGAPLFFTGKAENKIAELVNKAIAS